MLLITLRTSHSAHHVPHITFQRYDVKQGAITADFVGHEGSVKCVNVNVLNPFVIASGGRDGAVCIWDSRTAQVRLTVQRCMLFLENISFLETRGRCLLGTEPFWQPLGRLNLFGLVVGCHIVHILSSWGIPFVYFSMYADMFDFCDGRHYTHPQRCIQEAGTFQALEQLK